MRRRINSKHECNGDQHGDADDEVGPRRGVDAFRIGCHVVERQIANFQYDGQRRQAGLFPNLRRKLLGRAERSVSGVALLEGVRYGADGRLACRG